MSRYFTALEPEPGFAERLRGIVGAETFERHEPNIGQLTAEAREAIAAVLGRLGAVELLGDTDDGLAMRVHWLADDGSRHHATGYGPDRDTAFENALRALG